MHFYHTYTPPLVLPSLPTEVDQPNHTPQVHLLQSLVYDAPSHDRVTRDRARDCAKFV